VTGEVESVSSERLQRSDDEQGPAITPQLSRILTLGFPTTARERAVLLVVMSWLICF